MRSISRWAGAAAMLLAGAGCAAWRFSPWPAVLAMKGLARLKGGDGDGAPALHLRPLVPAALEQHLDVAYDGRPDTHLDVFHRAGSAPLPTIVWVHGGAWIAGTKNELRDYLQILAGHGFTTVGIDYSHAPAEHHPTPTRQLAAALEHLVANHERYAVDPTRIVLAGDSAGAQIAAEAALAITDAGYAADAGLPAPIRAEHLRAVLLCAGPYDLRRLDGRGFNQWISRTILRAYSGRWNFHTDQSFRYASVVHFVSGRFPPTFITAGNGDPLLPQSLQMARALRESGVDTAELFFDPDRQPPIPHEYQLDLHTDVAQQALAAMVELVRRTTSAETTPTT